MIYTDGNRICADTYSDLILFAKDMGMSLNWYIEHNEFGYFEIFGNMRKLILRTPGVKYIAHAEFLIKSKDMYNAGRPKN